MAKTKKSLKPVSEILQMLESKAPSSTAEDWDNVGLLTGDPSWRTRGVVLAIDLTRAAISAAKQAHFRLIINHHPCIFPGGRGRGLSRIVSSGGDGNSPLVFDAIREGIAIASYHTNFDQCALEVIEEVSGRLGVIPKGRLMEHGAGSLLKLVVFVPSSHEEAVRKAVCDAGAGHIGNYDSCSFSSSGDGTFRGLAGTTPFIGTPGKIEKTAEKKLETVFPRGLRGEVLRALRAAHPYEEIAYDLIPIEQAPSASGIARGVGYGFWGDFPSPRPFSEVVKGVKRVFQLNGFILTDPASGGPSVVRRVGYVAGKGASFVDAAAAAGCDLFITGEAGYHIALAGARKGMHVMEIGHRESEKFFVPTVEAWVQALGLETLDMDRPTQNWTPGGKK